MPGTSISNKKMLNILKAAISAEADMHGYKLEELIGREPKPAATLKSAELAFSAHYRS